MVRQAHHERLSRKVYSINNTKITKKSDKLLSDFLFYLVPNRKPSHQNCSIFFHFPKDCQPILYFVKYFYDYQWVRVWG
ncbi:Uncharacterised protein [Moraxella lacunata]|uniref:Uncharacterized protein n=1 Tax=Moraxella lacunata TaxID=477 RepID=A0A378TTM3_MORLA|nr:Uncharacterised protein [Moraxella lacunata]